MLENKFIKKYINKKTKYGYYFIKNNIIYITKSGFKIYFKNKFNININKQPDEAFVTILDNICYIKILEKKNQNVEGTVEDKLKTGNFNKREYEKIFEKESIINKLPYKFIISYAFCINTFLHKKMQSEQLKYIIMKEIMLEDDITLFYGEDENYFNALFEWINKN